MCGRYTLANPEYIKERYGLELPLDSKPNNNVYPGSQMPVIFKNSFGKLSLDMMKWGFIPSWGIESNKLSALINARIESIDTKVSFKDAFINRRCIIPVNGFYEWKVEGSDKSPYLIKVEGAKIFSLGGIYELALKNDGSTFKSYSIVTTNADKSIKDIHDRMPLVLDDHFENLWLGNDFIKSNFMDRYRDLNLKLGYSKVSKL